MADDVHEFDKDAIAEALDASRSHYSQERDTTTENIVEDGHLFMAAGCISATVKNGKICLNLPLGFGRYCFPIPSSIPMELLPRLAFIFVRPGAFPPASTCQSALLAK
ncbi:hypothetical protein V8J82_19975 [Gymnodinialimonas sp. 2305UL16-5]|uniref:hypothetical protein n=1 Tax=Gymnodinialimonas mytili TaxID=3126503 RepID=UPI0030AB4214